MSWILPNYIYKNSTCKEYYIKEDYYIQWPEKYNIFKHQTSIHYWTSLQDDFFTFSLNRLSNFISLIVKGRLFKSLIYLYAIVFVLILGVRILWTFHLVAILSFHSFSLLKCWVSYWEQYLSYILKFCLSLNWVILLEIFRYSALSDSLRPIWT